MTFQSQYTPLYVTSKYYHSLVPNLNHYCTANYLQQRWLLMAVFIFSL